MIKNQLTSLKDEFERVISLHENSIEKLKEGLLSLPAKLELIQPENYDDPNHALLAGILQQIQHVDRLGLMTFRLSQEISCHAKLEVLTFIGEFFSARANIYILREIYSPVTTSYNVLYNLFTHNLSGIGLELIKAVEEANTFIIELNSRQEELFRNANVNFGAFAGDLKSFMDRYVHVHSKEKEQKQQKQQEQEQEEKPDKQKEDKCSKPIDFDKLFDSIINDQKEAIEIENAKISEEREKIYQNEMLKITNQLKNPKQPGILVFHVSKDIEKTIRLRIISTIYEKFRRHGFVILTNLYSDKISYIFTNDVYKMEAEGEWFAIQFNSLNKPLFNYLPVDRKLLNIDMII